MKTSCRVAALGLTCALLAPGCRREVAAVGAMQPAEGIAPWRPIDESFTGCEGG